MKKSNVAMALCLTLIAAAPAQVKTPTPPKRTMVVPQRSSLNSTFNLDFPGGNVQTLVAALSKIMPQRPNILVTPVASQLPVPPLKLVGVDLRSLFMALPTFMGAHTDRKKVELRVNNLTSLNGIITLYTYQRRARPTIPNFTEVINVADLLEGNQLKITDLVTAIETAWAMNSQDQSTKGPQLKFHKETNLLLVKGSDAAVHLVKNVVRQLQISYRSKLELTKVKKENQQLKKRLADLENELAELKKPRKSK